jgi:hypothetical protein
MTDMDTQNVDTVARKTWVTPAVITASVVKHSEGPLNSGVGELSTDDFGS